MAQFDHPRLNRGLSLRARSSVGRAPLLHSGGHQFESGRVHHDLLMSMANLEIMSAPLNFCGWIPTGGATANSGGLFGHAPPLANRVRVNFSPLIETKGKNYTGLIRVTEKASHKTLLFLTLISTLKTE